MTDAQFQPKPISAEAIPRALQKIERYRLLNQSWAAESICRDVLAVDAGNQQALVMLVLSLTDQFAEGHAHAMRGVREVLPRITDPYQRAYYTGIAAERSGQALRRGGGMDGGSMAYDAFREAMGWYEKAEAIRPAGNDDAILRWNTCARVLAADGHLRPRADTPYEPSLEE